LFTFGSNGCLSSIDKDIFEEGKDIIHRLKNFENSTLKASTQFVKAASKDDLLRSINKIHSESIETQFKERLEIIEGSTTTEGDFIIILDSVNQDYYKSKSTIVLHVSTKQTNGVKVYDCLIHSVCFALKTSVMQVLLYTIATVFVSAVVATSSSQYSGRVAASICGAGFAYSALNVRPHMPDFVENALNLLMVETLKTQGLLMESGTKYMLKMVDLSPRIDSSIDSSINDSKVDSSERDD
jgi:hypothetical protein